MKPKCKLHKAWPSIKPKGCKVHPRKDKHKHHKTTSASTTPTRSESIVEKPKTNMPRRITPVATSSTPSSQSNSSSAFSAPTQESTGRNSSKMRIEAMVEKRIKSHNRQPILKKGLKTIKRMSRIFGRS